MNGKEEDSTRRKRPTIRATTARSTLPPDQPEARGPGRVQGLCTERGLSAKLVKPEHQRRSEVALRNAEDVRRAMARSRTARKDPGHVLDRIVETGAEHEDLAPRDRMVAQLIASFSEKSRPASTARFRELLSLAHDRTKLVSTAPVIAAYPRDLHNTFLGGLAAVATHGHAWLRPLSEWKVVSSNPRRQFGSLVRHLFAEYPVPVFIDSVWFRRSRAQNWFLHLGRGGSIRSANRLYFSMTKREAHEFMQAPESYTLEHALRWAQIHALDGNRRMADALCGTRLGDHFAHNDFWLSVLRFFVQNPFLDTVHYGPIVDYIHNQRFEAQEVFDELIEEGRAMSHCIATYARSCASGRSSVWSMKCEDADGRNRVLTIEVKPSSRMVMEARGRFNAAPTPQAMRILHQWTEKAGLSLAAYVAL